jgi:hypothetical protein
MEAFRDNSCAFLTNARMYRPETADKPRGGRSYANVPPAFKSVKGADCSGSVRDNIRKYAPAGSVTLKYIIMPGLNDGAEDIDNFTAFAKEVNGAVVISRDLFGGERLEAGIERQLEVCGYFARGLRRVGFSVSPFFCGGAYKEAITKAPRGD